MLTPIAFALIGFIAAVALVAGAYVVQCGLARLTGRPEPLRARP
jgi:hypothetical protein